MKHFVVTIGREFGSRGLLIGKKLGELLGVKCYDKEIAQMAGDELNMYRSDLSSLDEVFSNQTFRFLRFTGGAELERFDKLQETQARIIKEIAERESSIFIGRCAGYVLRDRKDCVRVFVYAPFAARCLNIMDDYRNREEFERRPKSEEDHLSYAENIQRLVFEMDKRRHNYYKHVTGNNRGERADRDLIINSAMFGIDGTASTLETCIRSKFSD